MVKKLAAMRSKKGFTLVELVVVIAIIGVLAAVLIPVLILVSQDSSITSADTTAEKIRTYTNLFITQRDPDHRLVGTSEGIVLQIEIDEGGYWKISNEIPKEAKFLGIEVGDRRGWQDDEAGTGQQYSSYIYTVYMEGYLRPLKNTYAEVTIKDASCIGVAVFTENKKKPEDLSLPQITDWEADCFDFGGDKAGLCKDGTIIGTCPKLPKPTEESKKA